MEAWSVGARWRYGAWQSVGLGLIAGAGEVLVGSLAGRQPWTWAHGLGLGVVAMVLMGAVAGVAGMLMGPVHTLRSHQPGYRNVALQVGLVGGALTAVYLLPWASALAQDGRTPAAVAMAFMPVGTVGVLYFNARYWLARVETGKATGPGWVPVALAAGVVAVVAAAGLGTLRDTGGRFGLDTDPSVVLVTVDGLRRDEVGAVGGAPDATPRIDAWAADAMAFTNAVTPSPSSVAAHATLLTGLHPLRHQAVDDMHGISRGLHTVPELFEEEGFATAAFVSSQVVVGVGLDQGFRVFDDAMAPLGLDALVLVRWLGGTRWARRDGAATVDAFDVWLDDHAPLPFFAWVHLERVADAPVGDVDGLIGRIVDGLAARGLDERTLVMVVGATGARPGDPATGLAEALVRVPLIVRAPRLPMVRSVPQQVRLMDVPVSAVAFAALDRVDQAEGIDLLGFGDGRRSASVWCALVGTSDDGDPLIGLRQDDVKAVMDLRLGDLELYDVELDPGETHNLSLEQPEPASRAEALLAPDATALRALAARQDLGPGRLAHLRALGVR